MIKIKKGFFTEATTVPFLKRLVIKFKKSGLIKDEDFGPNGSEKFEQISTAYSSELAKKIYSNSKLNFENHSQEIKDKRKFFEESIQNIWGEPLMLLDIFLFSLVEIIEIFNLDHKEKAKDQKDHKFEALIRINYKACRTGYEILALLEKGFADGALAMWRTLNELEVTALFIQNNDDVLAEKYLAHETIESYQAMVIYQNSFLVKKDKPFTNEQMNAAENKYNELINKYGKDYKENYGWASNIIQGNSRPNFTHIEEFVNLKHGRPHVKMANHLVHATAKGLFFTLGVPDSKTMLLSGPSQIGLTKPGCDTAISLMRTCLALLFSKPKRQNLVVIQTMQIFADEIGKAFNKVEKDN